MKADNHITNIPRQCNAFFNIIGNLKHGFNIFSFFFKNVNEMMYYFFLPFQTMGYLQRADSDQLRAVFEKYASANVNGVPYMTDEDFVVKFLQLFPSTEFNKHSVKLLCGILDQSKDG